ncbi:MAG: hypothetical protein AAF690_11100 [Acidobacteriota bacterium]
MKTLSVEAEAVGLGEPRSAERSSVQGLSRLLRVVGATVLLVAASVFLFQQWDHGSDLVRYASLGGMTLMLSVAGFLCSSKIGESKSARTLLGTVLAVTPVHFAVLGGFLYSQISWDGLGVRVPSFAVWTASSASEALLLTAGSLAGLAPLVHLSMLTLTRGAARRMTVLFLAANALLLLPVRTPNVVALLAAALSLGLLWFETQKVPSGALRTALRTPEGRFCRLLLVVPLGVLVGRCVLYQPSIALGGTLLMVAGFALHRMAQRFGNSDSLHAAVRTNGSLLACIGWIAVAIGTLEGISLPEGLYVPFLFWPCSAILLGASALAGKERRLLRTAGLISFALVSACNMVLVPNAFTAFAALALGVATLAYGYWTRNVLTGGAGLLCSVGALWMEVQLAIELFGVGRWGALAFLGTAIIVVAALLERHGDKLRALVEQRRLARAEAA